MNIRFILVGKAKEKFYKLAYDEYQKRLSKYASVSIEFISEAYLPTAASDIQILSALDEEADKILKNVKKDEYVVLLDLHGKIIESEDLAKLIDDNCTLGYSTFTFIIGSSNGVSDKLRQASNFKLSLSKMTFTHPMTLEITMEQVYRAFKINNNERYHK